MTSPAVLDGTDTSTIESLDLEASCDEAGCDQAAADVVRCKSCGNPWLFCEPHTKQLIQINACANTTIWSCNRCEANALDLFALATIAPLK